MLLRPDRGCLTFSLRSIDDGASSLCGISRFMATINASMHQTHIILAIHGFEASVAQPPALRQTTAHPKPERVVTETCAWAVAVSTRLMDLAAGGQVKRTMWNPCLTNDYPPILAAFIRPARPTFAFPGGTRLWKSGLNIPMSMLQEKTEISLPRALLVPEGVPRAPSL